MRLIMFTTILSTASTITLADAPPADMQRFSVDPTTSQSQLIKPIGKISASNGFSLILWKELNGQYYVETPTGLRMPLADGDFHPIAPIPGSNQAIIKFAGSAQTEAQKKESEKQMQEYRKTWIDPDKLETMVKQLKANGGDGDKAKYSIDASGSIVNTTANEVIVRSNAKAWEMVKDNHLISIEGVNYNEPIKPVDPSKVMQLPLAVGYNAKVILTDDQAKDYSRTLSSEIKGQKLSDDQRSKIEEVIKMLENPPKDKIFEASVSVTGYGSQITQLRIMPKDGPSTRPSNVDAADFYKDVPKK